MTRYINADALIQDIKKDSQLYYFNSYAEKINYESKVEYAIDRITYAPTEDVAPIVRGKWLRGNKIRCSVCGNSYNDLVKNPEETIELLFASKYCPFCGTRVKSLKEVTDESEEE